MVYQPKKTQQKKIYNMNSLVLFGKYKEDQYSVRQILDIDPKYIDWCVDNIDWFDVTPEVLDYLFNTLHIDSFPNINIQDDFDFNFR